MRRLKVDVDLDTGSLVIRTTLTDFSEVFTAAAINCYECMKRDAEDKRADGVAYHKGLLAFIAGVEELIRMQRFPERYVDPIPLITRDEKERRENVECIKRERLLLDSIIEEALLACRKSKEG